MFSGESTLEHILNPIRKASFQFHPHLDSSMTKFENNLYPFFQPIPVLLPSTSVKNKSKPLYSVLFQVEYFQIMIQGRHWPNLSDAVLPCIVFDIIILLIWQFSNNISIFQIVLNFRFLLFDYFKIVNFDVCIMHTNALCSVK